MLVVYRVDVKVSVESLLFDAGDAAIEFVSYFFPDIQMNGMCTPSVKLRHHHHFPTLIYTNLFVVGAACFVFYTYCGLHLSYEKQNTFKIRRVNTHSDIQFVTDT